MATAKRTYLVSGVDGQYLVIAANRSQAIHHVVSKKYHAVVADGIMVATLMDSGVKIERASNSPETKDMFGEEQGA